MSELYLLSASQMARIEPYFSLAHGVPRVDDRRVVSGIVYVIKHGLQWKDAQGITDRTRRFTIASSAGAGWAYSITSSLSWPAKGRGPSAS